MIRPDEQASWRSKTKPESATVESDGPCGIAPEGLPAKGAMLFIRWLTAGRQEGAVRGLGKSAVIGGGSATAADGRGVVVPVKPGNAGGGKGARKMDRGVWTW